MVRLLDRGEVLVLVELSEGVNVLELCLHLQIMVHLLLKVVILGVSLESQLVLPHVLFDPGVLLGEAGELLL